jgi:hypothetical protein
VKSQLGKKQIEIVNEKEMLEIMRGKLVMEKSGNGAGEVTDE